MHFERAVIHREIVKIDGMQLAHAPQLSPCIVLVNERDSPGILVDIEGAAFIDMARARLDRCIHHPYPVKLVPCMVGTNMPRLQDLGVLQRIA